ncbi:MAG: NAD(P)-dependent oxidoreductase [Chitinophagaceae bacterium]|nr:NAD(P)-dependent oxidoreductase [Chitinophagaceae bacterium]
MNALPSILITGASGFIGNHLVNEALQKKFRVYALVRKSSVISNLSSEVNILKGDVRNYEDLVQVIRSLKANNVSIDYIIHAAALTKANSAKELFAVNYTGTRNLYEALEQENYIPKKLVFISSLAACGPVKLDEKVEKECRNPVTNYGKSKLQAEEYVLTNERIPSVIIRPTAVYGPGERDLLTVFKMVNKRLNPELGFHRQQLTFIYVKDLVELIFAAAFSPYTKDKFFATDGLLYDKESLTKEIAKALNKKTVKVIIPMSLLKAISAVAQYTAEKMGNVSSLSVEKCKELAAESWNCNALETFYALKYTPHYSLEKGIRETTNWYKQNKWI